VLALPNDSVVPAGIQRNADWFEQAFKRRGLATKPLANNGKTVLFAELPGTNAKMPTVLFYMHLDGQAVKDAEWQQESPWKPTLKQRNANGQWPMGSLADRSPLRRKG